MMMVWMAKKSDIGDYECARNLGTGAQGGGRRAKPLLQGSWEERDWKEEWKWTQARTLNHLSPKGLVGF